MTTKITENASRHLKLMTGISAIFVIFIHAATIKYDDTIGWDSLIGKIQGFLSHNIFHVALPIFFLNSAFFLFLNTETATDFWPRIRKRSLSLLMPYLAWSGIWVLLGLYFNFLSGFSETELLLTWVLDPPPGQLWFLRDLISLVIISPLIFLLPTSILATLSGLTWSWWLWSQTMVSLDARSNWYEMISNEALCWFLIGALSARFAKQILEWVSKGFPIYILAITFGFWTFGLFIPFPAQIAHGLAVTSGTLFLLGTSPYLRNLSSSHFMKVLASYGFVIFVGHHPAISLLQEKLLQFSSSSQTYHLAVYIFSPLAIMLLLIIVFSILSTIAPKIVYIANGGRPLIAAKKASYE